MMTRIQFLRSLVGVGASVVGAVALVGCKDDDGSSLADAAPTPMIDASVPVPDARAVLPDAPAMSTCATNTATIASNHGHAITVSAADITAGVDKTYNITGTSAHQHSVTISAAMFTMLKAGMSILVTSSVGGAHSHSVMVTCS